MLQKTKILVVDDDRRVTEVLEKILESQNYSVRTENNSLLAHLTAVTFMPNLILLDVCMPDKDGGDVAQALRALPSTADVPVMFVTSIISAEELAETAGWIGGEEYISKPVSSAVLVDRVRRKLQNTRKQEQYV